MLEYSKFTYLNKNQDSEPEWMHQMIEEKVQQHWMLFEHYKNGIGDWEYFHIGLCEQHYNNDEQSTKRNVYIYSYIEPQ